MIPLRDDTRPAAVPWATLGIAVATASAFAYQLLDGATAISRFALLPARLLAGDPAAVPTLLTSLLLHASWGHIAANMLFLWVFGPGLEDRLSRWRFVALYAAAGVAGGATYALSEPGSMLPLIGASGAVSGVMGATLVLRPRAEIRLLVFAAIVPVGVARVSAAFALGVWLLTQAASGLAPVQPEAMSQVAWMAHLGGFAAGMLLGPALVTRRAGDRRAG